MNDVLILSALILGCWISAITSANKKDGTAAVFFIIAAFLFGLRLLYVLFLS